jgi:hypothetical protein
MMVMWSKDIGRTIDYLEERPDMDTGRHGYYGFSTASRSSRRSWAGSTDTSDWWRETSEPGRGRGSDEPRELAVGSCATVRPIAVGVSSIFCSRYQEQDH